jgi:transposase
MFTYRRVKNDERDAADLADLLRMGRLPESWIAPPEIRGLRELVRYRHKLVGFRTSCKDQIHAVLAKCGIFVPMADVFGAAGVAMLDQLRLPAPYAARINSLRRVIDGVSFEITLLADRVAARLARDRGYQAIQALSGIGPILAAIFVVEIGDITRFRTPAQLCSWAGLTPRHYESDTKVIRGHVIKQGSRMLRWAVTEAIQRQPAGSRPRLVKDGIIARRGKEAKNIAKVAAARELLTLVFYGMRDGHVRRALQRGQAA